MNRRLAIALGFAFILLLLNSAYVAGFSTPSIFYMANVLLHLCLGLALAIGLMILLLREPVFRRGISGAAMWFAAAIGFALYLVASGNTSDHRWALWGHIAAAALGLALLMKFVWKQEGDGWRKFRSAYVFALAILILVPAGSATYRKLVPDPSARIHNPATPPAIMEDEGAGPSSPFFPSSANTNVNG